MSEAAENLEPENLVNQMQDDTDGEAAAKLAAETGANDAEWKWNDELKGEGDVPEWFKTSKYGSIADQAKAYTELESKFGGFSGAPEEYEVALPEDLVLPEGVKWELEKDDPLIGAIAPVLKEMNASQDVFNKLVKSYVEYEAGQIKTEMDTEDQRGQSELASIPEGVKRVGTVSAWAKANMSDEDYSSFKGMLTDANSLQMAENLIKMTRNSKIPDGEDTFAGAVTNEDIEAEFKKVDKDGRNLYETDKSHRAKVMRMMSQYHG